LSKLHDVAELVSTATSSSPNRLQTRLRGKRKRAEIVAPTQTTHELLRIVRAAQPIPRVAVARRMGVHRRRITVLVRPLLDSGILLEGAPDRTNIRRVGRPAIGLSLRAEREFLIGVNIGVNQVQLGAASVDGKLLFEESFPTVRDPALALSQVRASIQRQQIMMPERALAVIGVSVAGPTDVERGVLLYAPHLGWRDIPITEMLGVNVPVYVENNATAAAIYESQRRRGRSATRTAGDFVLVRAGTGIGVGLVLGGEVFRGTTEADIAGEFGHMTIVAGGKSCPCGNFGCWERYASAGSAVELYTGDGQRAKLRSSLRYIDVVGRAASGERRALVTLERVGTHLGIGIGNVICGLGVPHVVVSGDLLHGWKFIEASARAAIAMSLAGRLSRWSLEAGELHGSELGGALEVAIEHYLLTIVGKNKVAA
jgi:predicted NBD/HSP70 family sugar kinase